mmetsp:Transcript_18917/g.26882  ORF Transcript_18917/g.26882 Transcript_18917/m.26882 type:complete len:107 (-) Transcript_18917:436-756(-)
MQSLATSFPEDVKGIHTLFLQILECKITNLAVSAKMEELSSGSISRTLKDFVAPGHSSSRMTAARAMPLAQQAKMDEALATFHVKSSSLISNDSKLLEVALHPSVS